MKGNHVIFAKYFAAVHRTDRRFWPERKKWMAYRKGAGWHPARAPKHDIAAVIASVVALKDQTQWLRLPHIRAGLELAEEVLQHDQWDANPNLLGLPGGRVVDLTTGERRLQTPDDFITMATGCDDGREISEPWRSFIGEACGGDSEMAAALQVAAGASAFGHNRDHLVHVVVGDGGTGKSTFAETIRAALGSYAGTLPASVLNAKTEQHPTGIAGLIGKRFGIAQEVAGGTFRSETLKAISGGDIVAARFMRADFFEFRPSATVWILTNEPPGVRMVDNALKRRLRIWPFEAKPATPDPTLPGRLRSPDVLPGVLRWIAEGAVKYNQGGLVECAAVQNASADYFKISDHVGGWFESRCERSESTETPARTLFTDYKEWCEREGVRAVSRTAWGTWIGRRVVKRHTRHGNVYAIGLAGEGCEGCEGGEGVNGFSLYRPHARA